MWVDREEKQKQRTSAQYSVVLEQRLLPKMSLPSLKIVQACMQRAQRPRGRAHLVPVTRILYLPGCAIQYASRKINSLLYYDSLAPAL